MSTVQTNRIQHSSGTGNNIILSADGDTQINSLNTSALAGFRNQVINPNGSIEQRGQANNSGEFGPDRWRMFTIDGGTVGAVSRANTGPEGVMAGVPSDYIAIGRNPGNSATGFVLCQGIEDWTRFMGKTYTLSWFDASDAGFNSFVQVLFSSNGTSAGAGNEFGDVGSSAANFVNEGIFGGWTRYSVTLNIPTLSTDDYNTMRASDNACLLLKFASNTGIAESNYGRYTAIQLEPGPVSTPLELRPIGTELALCQRYYQYLGEVPLARTSNIDTDKQSTINFISEMRVQPTASYTSDNGTITVEGTPTTSGIRLRSTDAASNSATFALGLTLDAEL